ncbi:MAG: T9SS type A sorting domain-containing protein [Saprospiraceae bacterium]|nr:T9SS type A sorting domain-containing protein [Saprospiraceae bacterium]
MLKQLLLLVGCAFLTPLHGQPGSLDLNFGNQGKLSVEILNKTNALRCITEQPDGKLIAGGFTQSDSTGADQDFALVRFLPDGILDSTFGSDGKIHFDGFAPIPIYSELVYPSDDEIAELIMLPNQKILACGTAIFGSPIGFQSVISVYCMNPDGTLDINFGDSGKVVLNFLPNIFCNAAALQPDGKILLGGGSINTAGDCKMLVFRLNEDGSRDLSFGSNGYALFGFPNVLTAQVSSIAVHPEGKILLSGYDWLAPGPLLIARLRENGVLDTEFSGDGLLPINGYDGGAATDVIVQPDGKILLLGYGKSIAYNRWEITVIRFLANGTADLGFGFGGRAFLRGSNVNLFGYSLQLQSDGNLLVSGFDFQDETFIAARLLATGQVDSIFGTNGIAKVGFDGPSRSLASILASDGRLILAGQAGSQAQGEMLFAALQTGPTTGAGDGQVLTTDCLVFPNPASEQARIVISDADFLGGQFTVFDVSGGAVFQKPIESQEERLDIQVLSPGVYQVKCFSRDLRKTEAARLVVMRK